GRRGLAAPHAWDHAVAAVLLDVGVRAFVDEAALRVVLRFLGPGADEVVVDRGAAAGAAIGRAPAHAGEGLRGAGVLVLADGGAHGRVAVVGAAAEGLG